ncbi:hypothetical protein TRAPUB_2697 [Trametes pubescens]|uniref:Uncharacterized protein n=1 Tax=Trametes pubescens TaxID=154538 RepID=A0A1M2VFN4_TRAPU|nr:hypothetical protein TRAPUB_2697 [Trametes pubescens]
MGNRMYLVPVQGGHVQAAGAVNTNPTHGFAAPNGANQNAIAGPAGGNGAHTTADNQENVPPRGARRRQRAPGQPSLRELRRRRAAINANPSRQQQSRARRVLAALNGQQVRDLREVTLDEVTGNSSGAPSEYVDLSNGTVPDATVLQDPYSFPSMWTSFNEDA